MKSQRKLDLIEILYLSALLLVGVMFVFFYRGFLVYSYDIDYHRLFAEHLFQLSLEEMSQIDELIPVHAVTYPLYHLTLKALALVLGGNYHWASYLLLAGVNVVSILLFRILISFLYKAQTNMERLGLHFLSIAGIVFVVARSPLTGWRFYEIQCAANPLHNPTVLFVRPFGAITFIAFVLVFAKVMEGQKYSKELILFSTFLFLSVLAKPNFAFVFLPAMGLVTLIFMIQNKVLKIGFQLLGSVMPSALLLVIQFAYLSANTEAVNTQIVFGGFTGLSPLEVIMASLATFPVVIVLFSAKTFKQNFFYRTSILALVIGWLQMFLLTNGRSGDFSWGYDLAVQFSTIVTIACAINNDSMAKWRKYLGYVLFAYQVFCGIQYIILVNSNGIFRI